MKESIFDSEVLGSRYFFPRQAEFPNPFWVDCQGARLSCYRHQVDQSAPTIIFFHGNGEIVLDYVDSMVPIFSSLGFNSLLAEYRGYSMSSGRPALVTMLDDVDHIINALKAPLKQVVLFGRSIGSIYAIHGASRFPDIPGLIIESGVANVLDRILLRVTPEELGVSRQKMKTEVATHLDAQKKLSAYKGATLVMHARWDSLLHISHGQKLFDWAPEPKRLKIFDRGDHNDIFYANSSDYIAELSLFLSQIKNGKGNTGSLIP